MPIGNLSITITGDMGTTDFLTFFFPNDLVPIGASGTEVQLFSAANNSTTTITGSGFVFDETGTLVDGTIQSISTENADGAAVVLTGAQFNGLNFSLASAGLAVGNFAPLESLLNDYAVTFNASKSIGAIDASFVPFLGERMITGSARKDFISVDDASETTVYGRWGDDEFYLDNTDDQGEIIIYGGKGDDSIFAGVDNARYYGGAGNDLIEGYLETENTVAGGGGNDDIDVLVFGTRNVISGQSGNDKIIVIAIEDNARNVIRGGTGDDILVVEGGRAFIRGGVGSDTFVFDANGTQQVVACGDFNTAEDILVLQASSFARGMTAEDIIATHGVFTKNGFASIVVESSVFTFRNMTSFDDVANAIRLLDDRSFNEFYD